MAQIKTNLQYGVTGSLQTANIAGDAIDGTKIADDAINSEHYAGTSVDDAHINDVASSKLTGTIATARLGSGTASSSTFLRGDQSYAEAGGMSVSDITGATALAAEPASTDEFVLSDAGTLKRMDFSHISNVPYVLVGGGTSLYPTNNTATLVPWDDETIDIGGCFNATGSEVTLNSLTAPAHSFVPNVAGIYNVTINIYWAGEGVDGEFEKEIALSSYFNGAHYYDMDYAVEHGGAYDDESATSQLTVQYPFNGSGDYFQLYVYNNTGETPELNFGYSSMTIYKLIGTGTATRPNYG